MNNSIINKKFKYTNHNATFIIAGINIVIFFLCRFVSMDLAYYLSLIPVYVRYSHMYWQFFTYMFVQVSPMHLISNMLVLIIFGQVLERSVGTREFLLYYLLCGTLSGITAYFIYILTGQWGVVLLGASGAIYSLLMLFATLYPNSRVYIFGIIPVRAPILVLLYFVIDFVGQFRSDGIAHSVHLLGLLFGFLYILIRMKINPLRQWGIIK